VPFVPENNYEACFKNWPETNGKVTWEYFRNNLNEWEWRMTDIEKLTETVNEFFAKAYKFKM